MAHIHSKKPSLPSIDFLLKASINTNNKEININSYNMYDGEGDPMVSSLPAELQQLSISVPQPTHGVSPPLQPTSFPLSAVTDGTVITTHTTNNDKIPSWMLPPSSTSNSNTTTTILSNVNSGPRHNLYDHSNTGTSRNMPFSSRRLPRISHSRSISDISAIPRPVIPHMSVINGDNAVTNNNMNISNHSNNDNCNNDNRGNSYLDHDGNTLLAPAGVIRNHHRAHHRRTVSATSHSTVDFFQIYNQPPPSSSIMDIPLPSASHNSDIYTRARSNSPPTQSGLTSYKEYKLQEQQSLSDALVTKKKSSTFFLNVPKDHANNTNTKEFSSLVVVVAAEAAAATIKPNLTISRDEQTGRYYCPFCNKAFNRPSSLRIHTYSHTGEKPFVCQEKGCGRQFSVQSNMRRHLRVHRFDRDKQ